MIKIVVALSTLLVGLLYTRSEWKALLQIMRERDYLSWHELNREVAIREFALRGL